MQAAPTARPILAILCILFQIYGGRPGPYGRGDPAPSEALTQAAVVSTAGVRVNAGSYSSVGGRLEETQFLGQRDGMGAVLSAKLAGDVVDVGLDRAQRNDQPGGDLFVR